MRGFILPVSLRELLTKRRLADPGEIPIALLDAVSPLKSASGGKFSLSAIQILADLRT
jgi:hypothetical protein